jgi:hypothetical protein
VGIVVLAFLQAAAPAVAGTCDDGGRKEKAHESGRAKGHDLVERTWEAAGRDCAERARLEETVRAAMARHVLPAGANEVTECRHAGFAVGVNEALAAIADTCQGS